MEIKNCGGGRGIVMEWTLKGRSKRRTSRRKGMKVATHSTTVSIPHDLAKFISNDGMTTYVYEHFEKVCFLPEEPPKEVTYKKLKLTDSNKKVNCSKIIEIPQLFFNVLEMESARITFDPNKKDYISNKYGLITIDTTGYSPRKHMKRANKTKDGKFVYEIFIYQRNKVDGIIFHQDLKNILPENIYVYVQGNETHLTNVKPTIEHIETTEANLIDDLFKHHFLNDKSETILISVYIHERDLSNNKAPKIILTTTEKK